MQGGLDGDSATPGAVSPSSERFADLPESIPQSPVACQSALSVCT